MVPKFRTTAAVALACAAVLTAACAPIPERREPPLSFVESERPAREAANAAAPWPRLVDIPDDPERPPLPSSCPELEAAPPGDAPPVAAAPAAADPAAAGARLCQG